MESFESLLAAHALAVERYVKFRLPSRSDAEDVLQEIFLTAHQKFSHLKDPSAFKFWLIGIARNKCHDYFRDKAKRLDIPLDSLSEKTLSYGRQGITVVDAVRDTLELLGDKERQILYLAYWKELPQAEIAKRLGIPLGTVKSRLHTARQSFQQHYPYLNDEKGDDTMTKLPEKLPAYIIEKSDKAPFSVKWEELLGWMLIPRLGEKLSWGLYDFASGKRTEYTEMETVGKAEVHGIEGVEFKAVQYDAENYYRTGSIKEVERRFIAQLTDTHCRYLAESHMENGVRKCYTFMDGEPFMNNWGFGEDNCGTEIHMAPKGILHREGNVITGPKKAENLDVVGRYNVTINGKTYDTVCVMDIETFNDSIASEQYLDKNGRTVLWRRFNHNDWAAHRYQKPWTEILPNNERLTINGETYVHWYDCISDYIL